ncbi:MAG: hypothetical protein L0Y35_09880 [Flammeovirgaceae bacterium]|nr:hypothetical protein [Flammeovirgaceae bacterium]
MNTVAKIISFIFHPLLVPTYLMVLLGFYFPMALYPISPDSFKLLFTPFLFFTFFLPALNILFFRITGTISSIKMESRRERILPFLLIFILYALISYLIYYRLRVSLDDGLMKFLLITDGLVLASFVITLFYKVSVHSLGMTGLLGILLPLAKVSEDGLLFIPLLICIIITGMVMSARLQLGAHTPREVLVGAVAGFSVSFLSMIILF